MWPSENVAPIIRTSVFDGGRWLVSRLGRFTSNPDGKHLLISIVWEAGWKPELPLSLWRTEKYLAHVGNRTTIPRPSARSPLVCRLRYPGSLCDKEISGGIFNAVVHSTFLISNFRRVQYVVCFILGNSPASEFYMPTFRNTLSVPSS
jgi:hypothetical protein